MITLPTALAAPPVARADERTGARAQALFDEALALMKAGKYAEACPKLEDSDQLDPGMGTEYRLAECYESAGKIVHAWSLFRGVADEAQRAGKADRAAAAIRRAATIAPRLPMLFVEVPETSLLPGLLVQLDGKTLPPSDWSHRIPIEPGEHFIAAKAPRRSDWARVLMPREGTTTSIVVPTLGDDSDSPPSAPTPLLAQAPPPVSEGLSAPRVAALTVGGVGAVGVLVGTVFGLRAGSQWSRAKATCVDPEVGTGCSAAGVVSGKDASRSATLSTVSFVVGGAALLASGILWLSFAPPKRSLPVTSLQLAPSFGPGVSGAHLGGSF